jgi:hypothetical protein
LFLSGLRQRGLLELAEKFCRELLASEELPPARRAALTSQLALILADRARIVRGEDRAKLFLEASRILQESLGKVSEPTLALLLQFEEARLRSTWGQLESEEALLAAGQAQKLQQARKLLWEAASRLEELRKVLEATIRKRGNPTEERPQDENGGLTIYQLAELFKATQFQLGMCRLKLAESYPAESEDRAAAAAQAAECFGELARLSAEDRLAWPSRLRLLEVLRLSGSLAEAEARLEHWQSAGPPAPWALELRAEALRLFQQKMEWARLSAAVDSCSQQDFVESPALSLAACEALVALSQQAQKAGQEQQSGQIQARLQQLVSLVQSHHDPATVQQVRLLLARHIPEFAREDPAVWIQAAQNAFHAGQWRQAIDAYDQAVELGLTRLPPEEIWQHALVAANIAAANNDPWQACLRYRSLALWRPDHPQAPEVHWLAFAQLASLAAPSGNGNLLEDVAQRVFPHAEAGSAASDSQKTGGPLAKRVSPLPLLPRSREDVMISIIFLGEEHRKIWSHSPRIDTIRLILTRLLWARNKKGEALALFGEVSPSSEVFPQAVAQLEEFVVPRSVADGATSTLEGDPELFRAVLDLLNSWTNVEPAAINDKGRDAWAKACLLAARIYRQSPYRQYARAEEMLAKVVKVADHLSQPIQIALQGELLINYVLQHRTSEAIALGRQLVQEHPAELASFLWEASSLVNSPPALEPLRSKAMVDILRELRSRTLDAELQQKVERLWLEMCWLSGDWPSALAEARQALARKSDDPNLQLAVARLILCSVFADDLPGENTAAKANVAEARQLWRQVESRATSRSPEWYEAKAALALLALRAGDRPQAERIVRLVQLTERQGLWLEHPAVIRLLVPLPKYAGEALRNLLVTEVPALPAQSANPKGR